MKTKEEKKKSNLWFMLFVLFLISVILCISSFGIATWARYRSIVGNNVEAQIAKWSFKVNGEEEQFADINLADTISFEHVENTTIAPGTYGSFDLDIDGRGSEVSLDYYIDMVVAQKPTNMKFYLDSNYAQPLEIAVGNKMYLEGDLLLSENPMRETRTIYWKWDYRTSTLPSEAVLNAYSSIIPGLEALITEYNNATGAAQEEIAMKINDKIDTQEAGGQVIVNVKVRGVQINPNFSLKRVQVTSAKDDVYDTGDTVNFSMEFTENVYGNNSTGAVTNVNAPVVTVGFGTVTASSPVVKVASLMQTNLKLSAGEKTATFVSASGNKINYSYTLQSGDSGAFRIAGITGSVYNGDGKEINFTTVQNVPEVIGGTVTTEAPVVVPIGGTTPVSSAPQIKIGNQTVTLTKENAADYYGRVVTNYNQANATYRLFYVDFDGDFGAKGTVYLKADQVLTTTLNTTASASSTEALNKMKQMNSDWATKDGIANDDNELGVLWLCDETKWSNYKDVSKADCVIGAPSIEMYVKSYNVYHSKKGTSGYQQLNCKWFNKIGDGHLKGYMYALGINVTDNNYTYYSNSNTLKTDENSMYVKSGQCWWLASPAAYANDHVCGIGGNGFGFCTAYCTYSYGVSPLVSLKSTFTPELEVTANINVGGQTVTLTKENAPDYYGKVVTNYNQANATYRLFYVDFDGDFGAKGTVYLKADQVSTTALNTITLTNSEDALDRAKQMNPDWAKNDGIANENNEKEIVWLCNKENATWKQYCDINKADWVIGTPSIEMYVKSYNAYHGKKGTNGYQKLNCKWFSTNVSGYKYALGDSVIDSSYVYYTDNNILKVDENNMYVKSGQYWWLASPSAYGVDYVCAMGGVLFILNGSTSNYSFGISPLVSLKSDFIPEFAN